VASLALALTACSRDRGPPAPDAGESAARGVVAPPGGLLLEASLRDPDAAWSRLQHGAGGAFALLPSSLGEFACAMLGLDEGLGALVDGHATAYAVVVQKPPEVAASMPVANVSDVGWVLGLRLSDSGARRMAALASASGAFAERVERGMHIVTRADPPLPVAVAIARGWLLVAGDERDLLESGPYVVGALPVDGLPPSPASLVARAPHVALVGPIAAALSSSWAAARAWMLEQGRSERERHGGRPPDFGEPEAIVDVLERAARDRLVSIAGARELRIEAETGIDDVTVNLRAVTGDACASTTGDACASTTGDARPLGEAPADSPLALLVRDDAEERVAAAQAITASVAQVLGSRLRDGEAREIDAAFEAWGRARGDWMTVGLGGATGDAFWVRAPAARAEVASRAIRQVLELSRLPPLRAPLAEWLHRLPVVFGQAGKVSIATVPAGGAAGQQPAAGVAWKIDAGDVAIAVGATSLERLAVSLSPGMKWADDARTARVLGGLGDTASFVAVAQPLRFLGAAGLASAPLALALGRHGGEPWARLDIADEVIAAGVRLAGDASRARP
jgi:hypothetical protein